MRERLGFIVLGMFGVLVGSFLVAVGMESDIVTGESELNAAFYLGLLILAVSTVTVQVCIIAVGVTLGIKDGRADLAQQPAEAAHGRA